MAEPDPGTQHTIRIQYTTLPEVIISVCLVSGQPQRLIKGPAWEPCSRELYNAIALECIGYPPG